MSSKKFGCALCASRMISEDVPLGTRFLVGVGIDSSIIIAIR